MNIKEAIIFGTKYLDENNISESKAKCRILLSNILNVSKEYLIIHDNEILDNKKEMKYKEYLVRLAGNEPIQYIINKQEFMKMNFYVDENVLIPQPDTEILVEEVIDKFKMLEEVVDINDFCINKVTTTTKKINHYGLFEDDTDFNDDNFEYDFPSTIIRNNNTHTLTGSSSEKTITKDINETVIGAYSLTYDEGYFYALETWDYDVKEDVTKTYVLSDEFVDKHLCLVNSKQVYSYFIEQLDDISFFDYQGIDLDTSIDYVEFTLSREKHFAQENITHSQNISLTFSNNGYVSGIEKTYCVYLGDKNENKILFLDSTKQILEII